MKKTTKQRKAPQVATGCCRWLGGTGLLINGTEYGYSEVRRDGTTTGHLLFKGDGSVYAVDVRDAVWSCDCADAIYSRPHATTPDARQCKHCRCLAAALPRRPQS